MIPQGALITIVHLLTLLVHLPKATLKSITVIALVIGATAPFGIANAVLSYEKAGIPAKMSEILNDCGTETIPTSARHPFVLRLDDVQSHAWRDISVRMIDDAISYQFKTTLGVIPYKLETDLELVNKLRARACYTDITLHGYLHLEDAPEFQPLSYEEADRRVKLGLADLRMITTKPITMFIPPGNKIGVDSTKAVNDNGMQVGAEGHNYLDYDATSYNFETRAENQAQQVFDQCQIAWDTEQKCIIMLHPQDFASNGQLDERKYEQFQQLLVLMKQDQATSTTLSQLSANQPTR